MVNEKILEFYEEFRDEVLGYVKENGPISTNTKYGFQRLVFVLPNGSGRNSCFGLYVGRFQKGWREYETGRLCVQ